MKRLSFALPALFAFSAFAAQQASIESLPYRFEVNRGKAPSGSSFVARGANYQVLIGNDGPTMLMTIANKRQVSLRTSIRGGNRNAEISGEQPLPVRANYLIGKQDQWLTNVESYGRVRYTNIYPSIDLVFYGADHNLEFDFDVKPGGDPRQIALEWPGAQPKLDATGDLLVSTEAGDVRWAKPVVYQTRGGRRVAVDGRFRLTKNNVVVFDVAKYDSELPLVIDPTVTFATFVGGAGNESARGIGLDATGNIFIAGNTSSIALPTTAAVAQPSYGGNTSADITGDAFVAKLNPTGTALSWITYLGGSQDDAALALAVDAGGNAYVTGMTDSPNFPLKNPATGTYQGGGGNQLNPMGDAFVAKLNSSGQLAYSTYLGGSRDDWGMAITVDGSGNAFVAGVTLSTNFPIPTGTAYQKSMKGSGGNLDFCGGCGPVFLGGDVFIAKYDGTGKLTWSTYLGGSKDDYPGGIAVDKTGNVYVAGATLSSDFPVTAGALQTAYGGASDNSSQPSIKMGDGFVTKLDATGSSVIYSTYLGGSRDDSILGIAVDATGAAYVTGSTVSANFPITSGAFQTTFQGPVNSAPQASRPTLVYGDGFAAKLNAAGSALVYSTYFGGTGDDVGHAITIDAAGDAYIAGQSSSANFPVTAGAAQASYGGAGGHVQAVGDMVFLELNPTGTKELYGTYMGGSLDDSAAGVVVDTLGNAWLTGFTLSPTFPATNGVAQKTFGGRSSTGIPNGDAFVVQISGLPNGTNTPTVTNVGSAASYLYGTVSPGEIIVVFGTNMGPASVVSAAPNSAGFFDTLLAGTRVYFDGVPSPMIYTVAGQLSAIVPYALDGKTSTQVQVEYNGIKSAATTLQVAAAVPAVFTALASGSGPGAIQNPNLSTNTDLNPAHPGDVIVLYVTGEGQTNPVGVDGKVANAVYPKPVLPLTVTIGGVEGNVKYVGAVPTNVAGICQINVELAKNTPTGTPAVLVKFGTFTSQANVTVAVK